MWIEDPEKAEETYGHISTWNTSKVTNMSGLFRSALYFNDDISKWNTSKVTDMRLMFGGALSFDQNIGNGTQVTLQIWKRCFTKHKPLIKI